MKLIKKWLNKSQKVIVARPDHIVSRKAIHNGALKVLYRLKEADYGAYLVGGCVRDLLLNGHPTDFDVVTDAHPEQVRALFPRNSFIVGRRFRLVLVRFGSEMIEVSTFRAMDTKNTRGRRQDAQGMLVRDNVYGTLEADVWRRDFTVNAFYYNIADFSIGDFMRGMDDLKKRVIRIIGDPVQRYHEDPVRMLRAIRFAAKLDFQLSSKTAAPIAQLSGLLQNIVAPRLFAEVIKLFTMGKAQQVFVLLRQYGLFAELFPQTEAVCVGDQGAAVLSFLERAFAHTDQRVAQDLPLSQPYLFAVLLWFPFQSTLSNIQEDIAPKNKRRYFWRSVEQAMDAVLQKQVKQLAIPHRISDVIREIWGMQYRFVRETKKSNKWLAHRRFKAAYDFLLLRAEVGDEIQRVADVWTEFFKAHEKKLARS